MPSFGLVGPTYSLSSPNLDSQRSINLFVEAIESGSGKSKVALRGTPGLHTWATLPTAPVRALWAGEDRLFAVGGDKVYEVSSSGTATDIGGGSTGAVTVIADDALHSPVQIFPSGDGTQIFIVSAGRAYFHDGTGLYIAPVPPDPSDAAAGTPAGTTGTAQTGAFLDSSFYASKPGSRLFFQSSLNNANEWDETFWYVKEGYPDAISVIFADHTELWIFGTHHSIEVWRNELSATSGAELRRDPGAFIHCALVAPWSVCSLATGLHFLGGDTQGRTVGYRMQGFMPVRVSNHAVEQAWQSYATVNDAIAYTYTMEGHPFWVINFMSANATWVYDVSTQMWHERAYWNGSSFEKHRSRNHAFVFGKNLVGDHTSGKIYHMSPSFYDDDGATIRRRRTAAHISSEEKRVFHHRLQIDLEVTTPDKPSVTLDWSDDDGATWSTGVTRVPSYTNKKGRIIWNRLGSARDRIYGLTVTDSVQVAIADAYLQADGGTH